MSGQECYVTYKTNIEIVFWFSLKFKVETELNFVESFDR